MPKYPTYKYEFTLFEGTNDEQTVLLAINESKLLNNGITVKVHKYSTKEEPALCHNLWISFDSGGWFNLENGQRTKGGKLREDFRRFRMGYPLISGNTGTKYEEIYS